MTGQDREEHLELLHGFVEEGLEMLEEVEPQLVEMEKEFAGGGAVDPDVVHGIFRLFHSLKGSAGYLGLETISRVTHQAETLLDFFRRGVAVLRSDHIDLMIRTCDFLRQLLENVEMRRHDQGFESEARGILEDLGRAIAAVQGGAAEEAPRPEVPVATEAQAAPPEASPEASEGDGLQLVITGDMVQQFQAESQELLEQAEEALLNLEKDISNAEHVGRAFRALHSFKGNAGLFGYADLERLSHQAETVLENVKEGRAAAGSEVFSLLLEVLDVLRSTLVRMAQGGDSAIPGLLGWISLLQEAAATAPVDAPPAEVSTPEIPAAVPPPVLDAAPVDALPAAESEATPAAEYSGPERRASQERRSGGDRRKDEALQRQSVRVDVDKLDTLLDLVGELVIAEAMVAQNPDLKTAGLSLDRFDRAVMHLEKISRDLQDVVTSMRMIPLSGTFRRMIRLVRDLAQKAGKKVELEIIGEETEVDKTVIEQINDPLVHLIRNAIDHGLETPAERAAAGKPEVCRVFLEAKYVGSEVWITIRDDGRGLNREKILAKARERELIAGDGPDLSDEQVWPMIFLPGFSTADRITDVSGRGVGMDVVKRNIDNLRGRVEVRSRQGEGASMILRLPLTLAIIDGMVVRVERARYIIPTISIQETLQPEDCYLTRTMDGQELLNIRGKLLPIVRLHELFHLGGAGRDLSRGLIIVVENEGRSLCLFVDELIGQQQVVIKGLSGYIGELPGVSGCTIMGDGEVSLILDVAGLFNLAQGNEGSQRRPAALPPPRRRGQAESEAMHIQIQA
ncbi:MAG: chemotaxis protein CheA [Candidatus Zixiibacteriota bacterium]|nr:MAG: chemotaxis protein CheA [candidate division Zixibacteria bacterium]